jgi:catechol 2,3-dioxygenase-like lactoylglutathione lyase family enzyme
MTVQVQSMVGVTYVRDLDLSRAFYRLLGFREQASDRAESSAWAVMRHDQVAVLLAMTGLAAEVPPLPMLFYFFYTDLAAITGELERAGVPVTRTGHPPHALGGEVSVVDPDGNTVLLGQRERQASAAPADDEGRLRFNILLEAAALAAARGGAPQACEVTGPDGQRCGDPAEIKLADSLGDSAWVCLVHADQILVTVPAVFIASHDDNGLAAFLGRR